MKPLSDKTHLERLSQRYREPLMRYFLKRIPSRMDAEDLVQEVFARLARRSNLNDIEKIEGYFFQTAGSVLADRYRRESTRMLSEHDPYEDGDHGMSPITPERVLLGREAIEQLIEGLHELPEMTRTIFALYSFELLSQIEIAKRLGVTQRTVQRHHAIALSHLMKRLK